MIREKDPNRPSEYFLRAAADTDNDNRNVAIKFFRSEFMFRREVHALTLVKHENIIDLLSVFEQSPIESYYPLRFLVTENAKRSLEGYAKKKPIDQERMFMVIKDVIAALKALRENGLGKEHFLHANIIFM